MRLRRFLHAVVAFATVASVCRAAAGQSIFDDSPGSSTQPSTAPADPPTSPPNLPEPLPDSQTPSQSPPGDVGPRPPQGHSSPRATGKSGTELLTPAIESLDAARRRSAPPLELRRETAENKSPNAHGNVKVVTGFDCSTPIQVEKLGATHFAVRMTTKGSARNWFLFRLEGVAGKTIRIDIKDAPLGKWWSLNPVYSNMASIDSASSAVLPSEGVSPQPAGTTKAYNGQPVPDTAAESWHYMTNVWGEHWRASGQGLTGTFCLVQKFDTDSAYVAMRAPYSPRHNEMYLNAVAERIGATVHNVGRSKGGRPLQVMEIGEASEETRRSKPCVVIYAREHADEQDPSWVVKGAIDFLQSASPEAAKLRHQLTFLLIPMLDPDGAVAGKYINITDSFGAFQDTQESVAYSAFFQRWVESGKRLDLVLNLHNVESGEQQSHVRCALAEPRREASRYTECAAIDAQLNADLTKAGYVVTPFKPMETYFSFRLGGWLMGYYGPLHLLYEINAQAPARHLTIRDTEGIGAAIVQSLGEVFASGQRKSMLASIDLIRRSRDARFAELKFHVPAQDNPILSEYKILVMSHPREIDLPDNFMLR